MDVEVARTPPVRIAGRTRADRTRSGAEHARRDVADTADVKRDKLASMALDEFESVRADPDPVRRARRATELLMVYQQRSAELADLRRDAINQAATDQGLTFSAIAKAIGLTKGRITQIRQAGPQLPGPDGGPPID